MKAGSWRCRGSQAQSSLTHGMSGLGWTTPDPLADKYYSISPYAFCNNNPVNFVDPDGEDIYRYDDKSGTFHLYQKNDDEFDQIARFKYNKDTGEHDLRRKRNGNVKFRMDNIGKGFFQMASIF